MAETMMYSTVQINSEPNDPDGMSFADSSLPAPRVLTASKPIVGEEPMAPPVNTPLHPKRNRARGHRPSPSVEEMKRCQLAELTACAANAMNNSTTATLMTQ